MVWISLIIVALVSGAIVGLIAAIARTKGHRVGAITAATLAAISACGLAAAYMAYLQTRAGTLPPDHFYHSVLGNAVVVGGMVMSFAVLLGIAASYVLILRHR